MRRLGLRHAIGTAGTATALLVVLGAAHYNHNFFVANDRNLFHWALVRDEVAADVTIARSAREGE